MRTTPMTMFHLLNRIKHKAKEKTWNGVVHFHKVCDTKLTKGKEKRKNYATK